MINAKTSKFKRKSTKYEKDCIIDIIDIEEAIKENKTILKCDEEKFLYYKDLKSTESLKKLPSLDDYYFELDNGNIKPFSDYYKVIEVLGQGSFSIVLSAIDLYHKNELVAIKVFML